MYGTIVPNVAGLASILLDVGNDASSLLTPGTSGTFNHYLTSLGFTDGGADIQSESYFGDIPCDDSGGHEGPPTDIQYFGETADIRLTLSKYDATVAAMISARGYGNLSGVPLAPGALMIAQWLFYRVVINTPTAPLNFPCVVFRKAIEVGRATKYSRFVCVGTAYKAPANHPVSTYRGILVNSDIADHNWSIPGFGGHT